MKNICSHLIVFAVFTFISFNLFHPSSFLFTTTIYPRTSLLWIFNFHLYYILYGSLIVWISNSFVLFNKYTKHVPFTIYKSPFFLFGFIVIVGSAEGEILSQYFSPSVLFRAFCCCCLIPHFYRLQYVGVFFCLFLFSLY